MQIRSFVVFALAVTQIVAGALAGDESVSQVADALATYVVPADYAFVIWAPIFIWALAFAVFQVHHCRDALLGRASVYAGAAFAAAALWQLAYPAGQIALSYVWFVLLLAGLVAALAVLAKEPERLTRGHRLWAVAPLALYAGWGTVALVTATAQLLVSFGWEGGAFAAWWALPVLAVAVAVAGTVARWLGTRLGASGAVPFGGAVVWGFVGIAVRQFSGRPPSSSAVAAAALVAAVVVAATLAAVLARSSPSRQHLRQS